MSDTKNERFIKAKDKYKDMHSSALSLIIMGLLGCIYMIVDHLKLLPFSINVGDSLIFTLTMIALFVIFIITGIYTFISAAKLKNTIADEDALTANIISWMTENLDANNIDKLCEENRTAAYDNAIKECTSSDEEDTSEISTLESEEYDIVAFESFYDIPDEMKAFEREEIIISLTKEAFPDATQAHISFILEDLYDTIFNA